MGLQGSIETGDPDFNTGNYIVQQLPPLCSVRGHAPCLPSATLPANVVVATGRKDSARHQGQFWPASRIRLSRERRPVGSRRLRHYVGQLGGHHPDDAELSGIVARHGHAADQQHQHAGRRHPLRRRTPSRQNRRQSPGGYSLRIVQCELHGRSVVEEPLLEQYNFGIEQQFKRDDPERELCWLGIASDGCWRLLQHRNARGSRASFAARQAANTGQPYPYTVPKKSWDHNAASASYNALQACPGKSLAGLTYMVSYTWSKTLDEGGDGFFGVEGGVPEDPYNPRAAAVRQGLISRRC